MKRPIVLALATCGLLAALFAQNVDITGIVSKNAQLPKMAIPDFRGAGEAQNLMAAFNKTLWDDVQNAGLFALVSKSFYPPRNPQQPSDFQQQPVVPESRMKRGQPIPTSGNGLWMTDWSHAPVEATFLTFGYAAVQNGVFVARGYVFDLRRNYASEAQVLGKNYLGSVDEAGARKAAHEFACDIITQFGGQCISGSHIYFVHRASKLAPKELWVMDPDGANRRQLTRFNNFPGVVAPAVSPDGTRVAFTTWLKVQPAIFVYSVDPLRDLRFYNQSASTNTTPSFTPDGKSIVYSSSAPKDQCCRIFLSNLDGSGFRPITSPGFIDVEPKINPKNPSELVFVSGRSGPQQIYLMNIDGGSPERITDGTGEASNPAWHPNGRTMAFSWTRGYMQGKFNVFVMDVATRKYIQCTHDEGRNENPTWAPDGVHLAFCSTRTGTEQIFTMLADGSEPRQLTTDGYNSTPVWGK